MIAGSNFARAVVLVDTTSKQTSQVLLAYAAALQKQVIEHIAPEWGVICPVRAASADAPTQPNEIELRLGPVKDDGALGEHMVDDRGMPYALIDPDLCSKFGVELSSTLSHELAELLIDGPGNLCCQIGGEIWDREVCDRVESDSYKIDGVVVSNFNTQACFSPPNDLTGVKFDFMGLSTIPNFVRPGGYAQRFDPQVGWTQVGEMRPYRAHLAHLGLSRGARRARGHRLGQTVR